MHISAVALYLYSSVYITMSARHFSFPPSGISSLFKKALLPSVLTETVIPLKVISSREPSTPEGTVNTPFSFPNNNLSVNSFSGNITSRFTFTNTFSLPITYLPTRTVRPRAFALTV